MKKTGQIVNISQGLNNLISPSSALYKEGWAYKSTDARLKDDGSWETSPAIGSYESATGAGTNLSKASSPNGITYTVESDGALVNTGSLSVQNKGNITITAPSKVGTRQESGIYVYMCTHWDNTNKVESLPYLVKEHWVDKGYKSDDTRKNDVPQLDSSENGTTFFYRSKCIKVDKGDTQQLREIAPPTDFYYLGKTSSGNPFYDYAHDNEIAREDNMYNGRGSLRPSTSLDAIASYDGRMFYFDSNVVKWSSVGRPEEVPQNYSISVDVSYSNGDWVGEDLSPDSGTITVNKKPRLNNGIYGETEMQIPELSGKDIVRADTINGKLWVWTSDTTGYITKTTQGEGYKYVHVSSSVGLGAPWLLVSCAYGIFGADAEGIWQIKDSAPTRVSDGVIDIDDSNKDTYITNITSCYAGWCTDLKEYWLDAGSYTLVYQPAKGTFCGPYSTDVTNNISLIGGIYQNYFSSGSGSSNQLLKFWLGQPSLNYIKDTIDIEMMYGGTGNITAKTYHNSTATETGATSTNDYTHTPNLDIIMPQHSGRFFEVDLTIPSTATLMGMNYSANLIPRSERRQQ